MILLRRHLMLLLIAAIGVQGCVLMAAWLRLGGVDAYAFASLDAGEYYRIAGNLARDGVFSQSSQPPLSPDTWRTPGYPMLLGLLVWLGSGSATLLVLVQQVLSALNVMLFYAVARSVMSRSRSMLACGLFLIEPYRLFYSLWLLATTWFVTVLLVTWLVWIRCRRRASWPWYVLLGALVGMLVLIRPVAILIPFALAADLLVRAMITARTSRSGERRARVAIKLAAYALACCAVLGSWAMRNRVVAGHFALSHQGGCVLAYFKGAECALWAEGRQADRYIETSLDPARADLPHRVWEKIDQRLREDMAHLPAEQRESLCWQNLAQGNKTDVDSFEISGSLSKIGRSLLLEHPVSTMACCLVRMGGVLTFPLNLAVAPPTEAESGRLRHGVMGVGYLLLCLAVLANAVRIGWRRLHAATAREPGGSSFDVANKDGPSLDALAQVTSDRDGSNDIDVGSGVNVSQSQIVSAKRGEDACASSQEKGHRSLGIGPPSAASVLWFPLLCTTALLVATTPQIDPRFRVPMIPLLIFAALCPRFSREGGVDGAIRPIHEPAAQLRQQTPRFDPREQHEHCTF